VPGIARSVELFNQAFRLAWPHLSQPELRRPNISAMLGDAIQRRLKVGEADAVKIAVDAIAELKDERFSAFTSQQSS
jgi:hypothetical protein